MVKKILSFADTYTAATQPNVAVPGGVFTRPVPATVNGVVTWADVDGYGLESPPVTIDSNGNMFLDGYVRPQVTGSLTETISNVLVITGANTLLDDTNIEVARSSLGQSGYLHSDDFIIFNNKQSNVFTNTGDLVYSSSGATAARLAIGTSGQVLSVSSSGVPEWIDSSDVGFQDPMTTVGDLIYRNALNETARFPIGANGQVLSVNGVYLQWINLPSGFADPMTSAGDIIIRNASNVTDRLAKGTDGQYLVLSGGVPSWQTHVGLSDPMTTAGDLIIRNASNITARLPKGTTGQVLTISGGGIPQWSTLATADSVTTNVGDMVYRNTSNQLARLPNSTLGNILSMQFNVAGNVPAWQSSSTLGLLTTPGSSAGLGAVLYWDAVATGGAPQALPNKTVQDPAGTNRAYFLASAGATGTKPQWKSDVYFQTDGGASYLPQLILEGDSNSSTSRSGPGFIFNNDVSTTSSYTLANHYLGTGLEWKGTSAHLGTPAQQTAAWIVARSTGSWNSTGGGTPVYPTRGARIDFHTLDPLTSTPQLKLFVGETIQAQVPHTLVEQVSTPAIPTDGTECRMYMKDNKLVLYYNEGGTARFKYLDLTGTGVTWVYSATPP